jgi:DNA-binding transcriptional LysR family regulator
VVCASKRFLRGKRITHPHELNQYPCLSFSTGVHTQGASWRFDDVHGQTAELAVKGPVAVNSSDVVRALVLSDMGIGLLPRFAVQADLDAGSLKQILPGWRPQGAFGPTAWALWQAQRHMPPKLRVMIDFLATKLGPVG